MGRVKKAVRGTRDALAASQSEVEKTMYEAFLLSLPRLVYHLPGPAEDMTRPHDYLLLCSPWQRPTHWVEAHFRAFCQNAST